MRTISRKSKKGVSPVIATIIIVAIAIVMSISVAYWMLGLGASFTRFEKLEFVTAYAIKNGTTDVTSANFTVVMSVKNTGSAAATIDVNSSMINGKPAIFYNSTTGSEVSWTILGNPTLEPGQQTNLELWLNASSSSSAWRSGMTLEIMLHTAAGKDYPKVVVLP